MIRRHFPVLLVLVSVLVGFAISQDSANSKPKPLKALLVAGGCCHDYAGQHEVLYKGIQARANVQVDVFWTDDKSVNPPLSIYDKDDWAKGYDVVIHDECAAGNKDMTVLKRILKAHETIPAVHLHCAMHSFRTGTDDWAKHIGLHSTRHGPHEPISVSFVDEEHPITAGMRAWDIGKDELYNNQEVYDAHPLAMGSQTYTRKGESITDTAIVAWTNEKHGARSFSTSLGHYTDVVKDDRYLTMVTRGLLWACGKLNDDYLQPFTGKNKITFVPKKEEPKPETEATPGKPPKEALLTKITASSEEKNKNNFAWKAIDGNPDTRWCASNPKMPQSITLEFDKPQKIYGASIKWESQNNAYRFVLEHSMENKGKSWWVDGEPGPWGIWIDGRENKKAGDIEADLGATEAKFIRITVLGTDKGGWASIREIGLKGVGFKSLYPKLVGEQAVQKNKQDAAANDPYAKQGNIPPKIVKLTAEEENEILKGVKVPEGFDVTVFSSWQAANYPVYVAATPSGDLYVASDGNGSLGRDPHRGRVMRLRDTDKDGRADEVTEFINDIDSPRGMVWDHDRLYLLHPPHITAFFDKDGDGIAEDSQRLIDDIAFGFADRPADHTTNALEMGIDGWIYIAGGDFGFMNAKGSDGTELQHRGGGVIRFRPDGSGLELFSTGTRNILGTPVSPLLDIFARDNTNDGGGWDVRFHHFVGLEDHGYPRMYKNFADEHIHPLADYGGGSGCGSVYIHEPGFPEEWANAPFTCDWGTGALWRHSVQRVGATFEEVTEPQPFIKLKRPTDADVDGMSAVYQASWSGPATFKWEGPEQGFIVRVTPSDYKPEPLPDFEKMTDAELVAALELPSHVRTLAAQRALLRRETNEGMTEALLKLTGDIEKPLEARVAALYALTQRGISDPEKAKVVLDQIAPFNRDLDLMPFVMRAFGDLAIEYFPTGLLNYGMATHLSLEHARSRAEAAIAAARLDAPGAGPQLSALLWDDDLTVRHVAFQALAKIGDYKVCLPHLGDEDIGKFAAFALMRMHDPALIDELISRLAAEKNQTARKNIIMTLARLAQREAEWKGDSWGTRPDTRGPYYQLTNWSETDKILDALQKALEGAGPEEASFIVREMSRNRIQSNEALTGILTLAQKNPMVIPDAVKQLAGVDSIPPEGIEILQQAAQSDGSQFGYEAIAEAVTILNKTDAKGVAETSLGALATLQKNIDAANAHASEVRKIEDEVKKKSEGKYAKQAIIDATKLLETASRGFLKSPKLENHHLFFEQAAAAETKSIWANAALLELASRKNGSPESRELSTKAIDQAWGNRDQKLALLKAAEKTKNNFLNERVIAAMSDTDSQIADAAKATAKQLKLQLPGEDKTPKIASLKSEEAVQKVFDHKGNAALGEALYTRATCNACHTVTTDEKQKGPYLGNIAQTYQRKELIEAILLPNKTIAQGFKTNVFTLKAGTMQMGFVTDEAGDTVTVRDITSAEHTFQKSDITKRDTLPTSLMPPGLMNGFSVHETASLVDYLEGLVK